MATILEGLNAISQAVGGTAEAESNLEALNAISAALGGSADAENNADAIANIAENASGGGGGSSDFSTAQVTIINQASNALTSIPATVYCDENVLGEGAPATMYPLIVNIPRASTQTIPCALYKGSSFMTFDQYVEFIDISVSGNGEVLGSSVLFHGDCTITISEKA